MLRTQLSAAAADSARQQAQHESLVQTLKAENKSSRQALQQQLMADQARLQAECEADLLALRSQLAAAGDISPDQSEHEAQMQRLRAGHQAALAQAQKCHASALLARLSELRAQHRKELQDARLTQITGQDSEAALAHIRAQHQERLTSELELKDKTIHETYSKLRTAKNESQELRTELTQLQLQHEGQQSHLHCKAACKVPVNPPTVLHDSSRAMTADGVLCSRANASFAHVSLLEHDRLSFLYGVWCMCDRA